MMILRSVLILLAVVSSTLAFEIPPLDNNNAQTTLESMGWKEVTIIAVLQGVDDKGSVAPVYSTIIALGTKDERHQCIRQTLYFDQHYGWFWYELGDKKARIWSKAGYQEIRPWTT